MQASFLWQIGRVKVKIMSGQDDSNMVLWVLCWWLLYRLFVGFWLWLWTSGWFHGVSIPPPGVTGTSQVSVCLFLSLFLLFFPAVTPYTRPISCPLLHSLSSLIYILTSVSVAAFLSSVERSWCVKTANGLVKEFGSSLTSHLLLLTNLSLHLSLLLMVLIWSNIVCSLPLVAVFGNTT